MPPQPLSLRLSLDDFVLTDGPTGVVVAPNESKHNFFRHLGLSQSNYMHQVLYEKMKVCPYSRKDHYERLLMHRQ